MPADEDPIAKLERLKQDARRHIGTQMRTFDGFVATLDDQAEPSRSAFIAYLRARFLKIEGGNESEAQREHDRFRELLGDLVPDMPGTH